MFSRKRKSPTSSVQESHFSSDESRIEDPFANSDDDKDMDYQLPKKSRNLKSKSAVVKSKLLLGKTKPKEPKKLTAKERIDRLKRKTHIFNKNQSPSQHTDSGEPQTSEAHIFENHDHMFEEEENDPISSVQLISQQNEARSNTMLQDPVMDSILEMQSQIAELTNTMNLLRKQMSRIEMKSFSQASMTPCGIESDVFMDLDASLAEYNLPLKTCVEINELELKLKNDSQYRNKLVRNKKLIVEIQCINCLLEHCQLNRFLY